MWRNIIDVAALLLEVLRLAMGKRRGKRRGVAFIWKRRKERDDDDV